MPVNPKVRFVQPQLDKAVGETVVRSERNRQRASQQSERDERYIADQLKKAKSIINTL